MSKAVLIAVVSVLSLWGGVRGQDQCAPAAQNLMRTCSEGGGVSMANFLWFVTNGTSQNGQAPADEIAFKDQICSAEPQIGGCIFSQLGDLVNTTCAQTPQVLAAVQNFLITYDNKCAHPCRFTLVDDLRQCYVDNGLPADLFLSNKSAGQIIGADKMEVDLFCQNRDPLLRCMNPIHDACPEALPLLGSQNFHLPSYDKGVNILCKHPNVYLVGLACFEDPTPQVEACVQKTQQSLIQANIDAATKNLSRIEYSQSTCKITIGQMDCDLMAWSKKKHDACNNAVIGLRREMECNLLPPNCTVWEKGLYDNVCHVDTFNTGARDNFGKPGSGPGGLASAVISLPAALLLLIASSVLPLFRKLGF